MTINEAIAQVDRLRDNNVPNDVKVSWLSRTDHAVYNELMQGREGAEGMTFTPYTEDDGTKELLVPPPYDELYIYKLEAQIFYEQREIKKYESSMALYNAAMTEYSRKYIRDHREIASTPTKYW
jgi:hypothetical protein